PFRRSPLPRKRPTPTASPPRPRHSETPALSKRPNRHRHYLARLMLRFAATLLLTLAIAPAQEDLDRQMKSVIQAYSLIERNAADPISSEQAFYQGAIPGLLRRLDPHSIFFDPGQFDQVKKMEASTQKGFGSV